MLRGTGPHMTSSIARREINRRSLDLVYVHSNLRLLNKTSSVDYTETTVEWKQWAVAD